MSPHVDQFFEERLAKARKLSELGVDPWGAKYETSSDLAGARAKAEAANIAPGTESEVSVRVAGRVVAVRAFGKATFVALRDRSGDIQAYLRSDRLGEAGYAVVKLLDLGDFVGVEGVLGRTKTGEITVFTKALTFLTKALRPLPEKFHGLSDTDTRFRQRYLDLVANPEVRERFVKRSRLIASLRRRLEERGFIEVETPMMQAIPGGATARPFITHHNALDIDLYMRISPELYLKRLLVGGLDKVFEIGRQFRNEGLSPKHNPEFTMMELYQAYGNLDDMMDITESVVSGLAEELSGSGEAQFAGKPVKLSRPWPRLDYLSLLREKAGVDPSSVDSLRAAARKAGVDTAKLDKWALMDEVFSNYVEPGLWDACFVCGAPIELTLLCKARRDDPSRAERFEAYAAGMELANAYTELNDAVEQRRRFQEQAGGATAAETGGKLDEDFLTAMEHGMPPAGGLGIGIDRLAMIVLGAETIREVVLFPLLRPREAAPAAPAAPAAEAPAKE
ncbi:MAG TPA: lysine--tRNA ligase [Planctomycetota bacterium]|nr:lysine--tRNA ligase [Planctomycetota bacterium]